MVVFNFGPKINSLIKIGIKEKEKILPLICYLALRNIFQYRHAYLVIKILNIFRLITKMIVNIDKHNFIIYKLNHLLIIVSTNYGFKLIFGFIIVVYLFKYLKSIQALNFRASQFDDVVYDSDITQHDHLLNDYMMILSQSLIGFKETYTKPSLVILIN
ncbi:hypothetical protein ACJX0J_031464 [Zea mays]